MNARDVPTFIDVASYGRGSLRHREGGNSRSCSMKMDFANAANRAMADYESACSAARSGDVAFDGFTTMDVAFHLIGSRLNDLTVRATELDDPALAAILSSLGLVRIEGNNRVATLVGLGDSDNDVRMLPGLCGFVDRVDGDRRSAIVQALRAGAHRDDDWVVTMPPGLQEDRDVLDNIAARIEKGSMESGPDVDDGPTWRLYAKDDR